MTTTIALKHWIKGAVETNSISNDTDTAALSPAYITSALRIAIALTRQISDAEDLSNYGLFDGISSLPPPFPAACIDWADCITVSLKPNDEILEHSESSLHFPSSASLSEESDDLNELLHRIAKQEEADLRNDNQDLIAAEQQKRSSGSYFNVDSARIFYENDAAHCVYSTTEKLQRIYSLGLVFYELFSGGDLPPLEMLVVASRNGGNLTVISSSRAEGEALRSAHCSGLMMTDFASTMNVTDDISLARGGSLGGSLNQNNVVRYECDNGYHGSSISNKRQSVSFRSRQSVTSSTGPVFSDVSVDGLRMKGVPCSLCDLIRNMIDCVNGDFMGNDSYSDLVDVTCDLQLMLDKPLVYLHDLDVGKLLLTGLDLNHTLFERNDEFASLHSAYQRAVSGSSELAIITGMSGTGKSTVANRFGNFVTANGGLFLSGKFDQMMQQVQPFSAFASAFNNYCSLLTRDEQTERAKLIACQLQKALGSDVYYLIQVIPNLSQIIYKRYTEIAPNQDDCVDAQERLHYLFSRFAEIISSCSGGPMALFLDDVQWADSASISIIGQLLKNSRSRDDGMPFFFLGCCRDDEMGSGHSFWQMIDAVSTFGFKTTLVKLNCMDKDTVTKVVSNLLHLSPRLVGSLSDIVYHKTKGNHLFVSRMLLSLNKEGLLRLSLTRRRWEWDEEKIQSRKLPDDVAAFFVHSINTLPIDVKIALVALSCFGASTECEIVHAIEADLNLKLIEPLNVAIAEGLLSKLDGRYCFCHDRIHQATYSIIDEQDRCLHHMNYAVTQLNLGGPSAVQNAEQYSQIVRYNLIAGQKAMEMSDFSSAFSFLNHGMKFLQDKHWVDQYDLSLDLFNLAAKCALSIKDLTSLTKICAEVSRHARNSDDMLYTSFISMSALTHSKIQQSVMCGFQVLGELGVEFTNSSSREETLKLIFQTQSMLSGIADETLLCYHILTDYKKIMAIKFLAKLESSINQTNPSLQPFITIKIIQLTIEHGMSPMSAIGFAYFGGMIAELGDIRGGYRYTKLAKALLDKNKCNEIAGEVLFLSTELLSYIEPLQVTNEYRIQGQAIALAAGDIHWACMNKLGYTATLFWSGVNLSGVKEALINAEHFSAEHDHRTSLYYIKTFDRTISRLVDGGTLGDEELTRSVIENKNPYQLVIVCFYKMFLSLVLNNYAEMKQSAEKFFDFRMPSWYLLTGQALHSFIGGLASFRIFRETRDPLWAQRGIHFKERIEKWKDQGSSWNFENKSFLLEAEECFSYGNMEKALVLYENAISSAQRHRLIHEEALAYELAGKFNLDIGNKFLALKHFTCAHGAFLKWGAFVKVQTLYAFIQEQFESVVPVAAVSSGETNHALHSDDSSTPERRTI